MKNVIELKMYRNFFTIYSTPMLNFAYYNKLKFTINFKRLMVLLQREVLNTIDVFLV